MRPERPKRLLSLRDEPDGSVVFVEGVEGYVREREWRAYVALVHAHREKLIDRFGVPDAL